MSDNMAIEIDVAPTPNPNAFKFISNYTVKTEGNSTYLTPMELSLIHI